MAASADSRHRSRLIREMARDLNRHDHSCASSTGSHHGTVSDDSTIDFDPENEAIMSTRQMDLNISQRLPELRDPANHQHLGDRACFSRLFPRRQLGREQLPCRGWTRNKNKATRSKQGPTNRILGQHRLSSCQHRGF
jgi:hypothetical protein